MSATNHMLVYKNRPAVFMGTNNFWVLADYRVDYEDLLTTFANDGGNFLRASLNAHTVAKSVRIADDELQIIYPFNRSATPGAIDSGNKFDCTSLNDAYFTRLDNITRFADSLGVLCLWILWDEIPIEQGERRWEYNPYNPSNNIQSFGLPSGSLTTAVPQFYDLNNAPLRAAQEAWFDRILDTIGHADNLILSHSNEYTGGTAWRKNWADRINAWETANNGSILTSDMVFPPYSAAQIDDVFDLHSLNATQDHDINPRRNWAGSPESGTTKIIPIVNQRLNPKWNDAVATARKHMWWCFCNAGHTGDDSQDGQDPFDQYKTSPNMITARAQISYFRTFINRLSNINAMLPSYDVRASMCSIGDTMRCNPGWEYVVYMDGGTSVNVDLQDGVGTFQTEWLDTVNGTMAAGSTVQGGATRTISGAPYADSVLWIHK